MARSSWEIVNNLLPVTEPEPRDGGQLAFTAGPQALLRKLCYLSSKNFSKLRSKTNADVQRYKVLKWMIPDEITSAGANR